jgi:hypothetical protein
LWPPLAIENRSVFSDTGPVRGKLDGDRLVMDGFTALPLAPAAATELDKQATAKLPPR